MNNAFIIGTGRCGTTWLGQMLNSHVELCVPPEIQLLFEYSGNGNRLFEEFFLADQQTLSGEQLASIIERGCPHNLDKFFDYHEFCQKQDTPKSSLDVFVRSLYAAIAIKHGKSWLIEQTPWYGQRLDLVSRLFPDAKFIHVVRDGRDVALSFARTTWWHKSPRLNLARWQREIKKITIDAGCFLNSDSYLEVRYESLVANTELELRRICSFLGIEFDSNMLDPKGFIDYDKFCKFDMGLVSSQAYSAWRERKDKAVFSENVEAWRRTGSLFDDVLPTEIARWLARYGYEVHEAAESETGKIQFQQGYNFNALELDNLVQVDHILALEQALATEVESVNAVQKEWLARGDLIEELSGTINALVRESELRAEHIHKLEQALVSTTGQVEVVEAEWVARGELLNHLSKTITALTQEGRERIEHINMLEQTLANQSEQTTIVGKEWEARGELLDQQTRIIDALAQESKMRAEQITALEQVLANQIEQVGIVGKEWEARGEMLEHLVQTVNSLVAEGELRAEHVSTLELALAKQTEQTNVVGKEWEARGELLEQLEQSIVALVQESEKRAEHISALEQTLENQVQQAEAVAKEWDARGSLIQQLTNTIDTLMLEIKDQSERIVILSGENIESANKNSKLDQDVADQKVLIGQLEERLDEYKRSWYGILKEYLGK